MANVDPKKYCTQLTRPPEINGEYRWDGAESFYLCRITEQQCIAREIKDATENGDVVAYGKLVIDRDKLGLCPAHNISDAVADQVMLSKKREELSRLEKKIKSR